MNRKQRRTMKTVEASVPEVDEKQALQQEYYKKCAEAGEVQYRIAVLKLDLDSINKALQDINVKFAEANKKEQEANEAKD